MSSTNLKNGLLGIYFSENRHSMLLLYGGNDGNNYWEVFSPKLRRNVRLFSDLEYDHWILIESDPKITMFCEQPLRIQQLVNGELIESIFDMWVVDQKREEYFIEVKYSHDLNPLNKKSARAIRQTTAQKEWCHKHGHHHRRDYVGTFVSFMLVDLCP